MEPEFAYKHVKDKMDRFMSVLSFLLVLTMCALVVYAIRILPDTIPSHINFKNEIDGYGSKYILLGPMIFGVLLYVLFLYLERHPEFYSYRMMKENKSEQFRLTVKMTSSLKVVLMFVFLLIIAFMIQTARYQWINYTNYLVVVILLLVFSQAIYWMVRYSRIT